MTGFFKKTGGWNERLYGWGSENGETLRTTFQVNTHIQNNGYWSNDSTSHGNKNATDVK